MDDGIIPFWLRTGEGVGGGGLRPTFNFSVHSMRDLFSTKKKMASFLGNPVVLGSLSLKMLGSAEEVETRRYKSYSWL